MALSVFNIFIYKFRCLQEDEDFIADLFIRQPQEHVVLSHISSNDTASDTLDCWRKASNQYPKLAKIATNILALKYHLSEHILLPLELCKSIALTCLLSLLTVYCFYTVTSLATNNSAT